MAVDPFDTGPLFDFRTTIKAVIDAELSGTCTVYASWGDSPVGPSVILDGGGWTRSAPLGFDYMLRINVCNANQAGDAVPGVEELCRQVWEVLEQAGYPIQEVPPPGTLKVGDRTYPAMQMKLLFRFKPEG